ncbi:MAG: hypothetical protein ACM3SP_19040 [Chloroflexota bacterium]
MKRARYIGTLAGLILVIGFGAASSLYADSTNEKTLNAEGSKIQVRYLGVKADVVSVKPYIKAKEGKKKGNLWLDVVVKNTGSNPQAYNIFGQAQTMSGGWVGGSIKAPKKGEIEPGTETTISVNTRYQAESVPKEIRVEVLPPK